MRILFLSREDLPTYRPDVSVLIEKELSKSCDISLVAAQTLNSSKLVCDEQTDYQLVSPSSIWSRILGDKLPKVFAKLGRGIRLSLSDNYDFIIVRDNAFLAFVFAVLCLFLRARSVFWVSTMIGGLLFEDAKKRKRFIQGTYALFYRLIERWAVKLSSVVVAQSEAMKTFMVDELGIHGDVLAVPMGIDEGSLDGYEALAIRRGCIGYLGSVDASRNIPMLLDLVERLRGETRYAHVTLKLVGGSQDPLVEAWLQRQIKQRGLDGVVEFTGHLERSAAWQALSECEVCVSYVPRSIVFDVSSPTKVIEYLALGKKVVANDIPDQKLLLERVGSGVVCESDLGSIIEGVKKQLELPIMSGDACSNMISCVLQERGYSNIAKRLFSDLESVLTG